MQPPITVTPWTNNLDRCELRIAGADGVAVAVVVPTEGNVYNGLHKAAPQLQTIFADVLAAHGITAPEPAEEPTEGDAPAADATPDAAPTEPAAPAPKKTAAAKRSSASSKATPES